MQIEKQSVASDICKLIVSNACHIAHNFSRLVLKKQINTDVRVSTDESGQGERRTEAKGKEKERKDASCSLCRSQPLHLTAHPLVGLSRSRMHFVNPPKDASRCASAGAGPRRPCAPGGTWFPLPGSDSYPTSSGYMFRSPVCDFCVRLGRFVLHGRCKSVET